MMRIDSNLMRIDLQSDLLNLAQTQPFIDFFPNDFFFTEIMLITLFLWLLGWN